MKVDDARGIFAFARTLQDQTVYVVLNRSANEQSVEIPLVGDAATTFLNWLDPSAAQMSAAPDNDPKARAVLAPVPGGKVLRSEHSNLVISLEPYSAAILTEQK